MKNRCFALFLFLVGLLHSFQCKKETTDSFCTIQRTTYTKINNKEGVIIYSYKYKRYAVSLSVANANNIDSQIIGFVCQINPEFQTVGLKVIVSGIIKKFNSNENMTPEIAGQDLYYFQPTQIIKKA